MQSALLQDIHYAGHPIDVMETIATSQEWPCERGTDDDVNICIAGTHCDYHLAISWREDLEGLHIACMLDTRVPQNKQKEVYELLALVNEQLWLGHFDMWSSDGTLLFRNTLMVNEARLNERQCNDLIHHAVGACERFFPAFQFLIWAGYSPRAAFQGAMFETRGDA